MTTLAHRSALRGPRSGGLAARRPLIRWAWRLFRREWRRQILVTALITVSDAAAVCGVTIAYNSGPLDYAEFGSASALFELDAADPRKLEASLSAVEERFGTTDVIGHRSLPGPTGRSAYTGGNSGPGARRDPAAAQLERMGARVRQLAVRRCGRDPLHNAYHLVNRPTRRRLVSRFYVLRAEVGDLKDSASTARAERDCDLTSIGASTSEPSPALLKDLERFRR